MYTYFVFTVFYYLFGRTERLPTQGGRERVLSPEQETEIMNMVLENNAITLRQIQRKIIENNDMFQNIDRVSLSTLDRVLRRNHLRMKQVYRVPFERNSERVKELRYNYVQVSPTIDAYSQQLCVGWEWDVHCVHCFCGKNKKKFDRVFVCSEYKNNILKYFTTHLCLYCL